MRSSSMRVLDEKGKPAGTIRVLHPDPSSASDVRTLNRLLEKGDLQPPDQPTSSVVK